VVSHVERAQRSVVLGGREPDGGPARQGRGDRLGGPGKPRPTCRGRRYRSRPRRCSGSRKGTSRSMPPDAIQPIPWRPGSTRTKSPTRPEHRDRRDARGANRPGRRRQDPLLPGTPPFAATRIVQAQWTARDRGHLPFRCEQPPYSILARRTRQTRRRGWDHHDRGPWTTSSPNSAPPTSSSATTRWTGSTRSSPPGTTINVADNGWTQQSLTPAHRRR
jgi:hypothetical protein